MAGEYHLEFFKSHPSLRAGRTGATVTDVFQVGVKLPSLSRSNFLPVVQGSHRTHATLQPKWKEVLGLVQSKSRTNARAAISKASSIILLPFPVLAKVFHLHNFPLCSLDGGHGGCGGLCRRHSLPAPVGSPYCGWADCLLGTLPTIPTTPTTPWPQLVCTLHTLSNGMGMCLQVMRDCGRGPARILPSNHK